MVNSNRLIDVRDPHDPHDPITSHYPHDPDDPITSRYPHDPRDPVTTHTFDNTHFRISHFRQPTLANITRPN